MTTLIGTTLVWCNSILSDHRKRKQDSLSSHLNELLENVIKTEMEASILDILTLHYGNFYTQKFPNSFSLHQLILNSHLNAFTLC